MSDADPGPFSEQPAAPEEAGPQIGGLLRYRLLTGTDDRAFCEKVSTALAAGYVLHGSPAITFDGERTVTAQAVVLATGPTSPIGRGPLSVVPA